MAPAGIPPPLPPTVEEAYRRKCVQLKHRTKEVQNANDAAHLRLNRMKRQVEKMRLERAFLLEQLSRRTSTNVEDSEGSPSPPPTPKEKPLRTKRGHRKGSLLAGGNSVETPPPGDSHAGGPSSTTPAGGPGGSTSALTSQNLLRATGSPSSDLSRAQSQADVAKSTNGAASANGKIGAAASATAKKKNKAGAAAPTPFELYCEEQRAELLEKAAAAAAAAGDNEEQEDDDDKAATAVEEELARGWKDLSDEAREKYQDLADRKKVVGAKKGAGGGRGDRSSSSAKPAAAAGAAAAEDEGDAGGDAAERPGGAEDTPAQDEDVEMGNYDSDQETQGEKQDE